MKVLVSCEGLPCAKTEWKRVGTAIQYKKVFLKDGRDTYALEFVYEIENPLQKYYFSYGYPYSFTQLEDFLARLASDAPLYHR